MHAIAFICELHLGQQFGYLTIRIGFVKKNISKLKRNDRKLCTHLKMTCNGFINLECRTMWHLSEDFNGERMIHLERFLIFV